MRFADQRVLRVDHRVVRVRQVVRLVEETGVVELIEEITKAEFVSFAEGMVSTGDEFLEVLNNRRAVEHLPIRGRSRVRCR